MFSWKRILFPTDFSRSCQSAQSYACGLAGQFGAELHLLHVLETQFPTVQMSEFHMLTPALDSDLVQASAELALEGIPGPDCAYQNRVIRVTRRGSPFVEIVRYARLREIDLIVIGTHGRTGLTHVLLGSVAENVVRKAHCAVLTVRPQNQALVRL